MLLFEILLLSQKKKFIRKIIKSNETRRNIYFSNLFQKFIFPSSITEPENASRSIMCIPELCFEHRTCIRDDEKVQPVRIQKRPVRRLPHRS